MAAKASSAFLFLVLVVAGAVLIGLSPGAGAATACDPTQLTPCASAIVGKAAPTAACCGKLKAHPVSCFCRYKKDPNLRRYVNSPNGKKVFAACKVPLPRC